jgi:hypothetical protein
MVRDAAPSTHAVNPNDTVMPAQAGIQYAAALRLNLGRSGILGPRLRGDDAENAALIFTNSNSLSFRT